MAEAAPPALTGAAVAAPSYTKPAKMSQSFFDMLTTDGELPQAMITFLADEGIRDLPRLARYCLDKQDVWSLLVQKVEETRDKRRFLMPPVELWELANTKKRRKLRVERKAPPRHQWRSASTAKSYNTSIKYDEKYGYPLSRFEGFLSPPPVGQDL